MLLKAANKGILRPLLESAVPALSDYSVGFARLRVADNVQKASLGGSGTLVAIDDFHGILTADHVLRSLKKEEAVGLILSSSLGARPHNITLDLPHWPDVSFSKEPGTNKPDLAFLILPPVFVGTLKVTKRFYNLTSRREKMLKNPPRVQDGFWMVSGHIDEWTVDGPPERGFDSVTAFRGTHGAGRVTRTRSIGKFDYRLYQALYNQHYEGPDSFKGLSGGGLWQVIVQPEGQEIRIREYILSGVAFYQSDKEPRKAGTVRDITCHGRISVYKTLIDAVRAGVSAPA